MCIPQAVLALMLLSCGQSVTPRWTPPPGVQLSPLGGIWNARCVMRYGRVARGFANENAIFTTFFEQSTVRIEQVGPNEFQWTMSSGPPGVSWDSTRGIAAPETWTMTKDANVLLMHPGERFMRSDRPWVLTMIQGTGTFAETSLSLNWVMRDQDDPNGGVEDAEVHASLTATRYSDL